MATLVFDIETSALPIENFDEAQQEYLFREAKRLPTKCREMRQARGNHPLHVLWPFTSQVVCIAMLNAEPLRGQVLFIAEDFEEDAGEDGAGGICSLRG